MGCVTKAISDGPYDVIVVGSGAAGMLAAIRLAELGRRVVVIEKSDRYGGTSAVSGGGIWTPNNFIIEKEDSSEEALTYLKAATRGLAANEQLQRFVETAPRVARYLNDALGIGLSSARGMFDYASTLTGAKPGRMLTPLAFDGKTLGEDFHKLRDSYSFVQLFGRYSITLDEAFVLVGKSKGWIRLLARIMLNYWRDIAWRRSTRRDSRLTNGQALVAGLRRAMLQRDIPLLLNTGLDELIVDSAGRVQGVRAKRHGTTVELLAGAGVLLTAGGFESSQPMRDQYIDHKSSAVFSVAPRGINCGDAILAGQAIGARLKFMEFTWRVPVIRVPVRGEGNVDYAQPLFWDRATPSSICVNRLGQRFVDEYVSYDDFGYAMLRDNERTGANLPCWMIFDAKARRNSSIGPMLPGELKPDSKLPPEWQDSLYYRANTIAALAAKINVDPSALTATVESFNKAAAVGVDSEFQRGESPFDKFFVDPRNGPNGALAPLAAAPFYAVRLDLGDLGTKGGLEIDADARVIGATGPIEGLYAAGNCTGSIFANTYPGPGGTLGPAMAMAMLAAEGIAAAPSGAKAG
jgi:3-oxosteroid 1-dehydrogenase